MARFYWVVSMAFFGMGWWEAPVWAQGPCVPARPLLAPIETNWDVFGGMQYLQGGKKLTGPELRDLIDSTGDPRARALLADSGSYETWGFIGLGGSVALSLGCLFLPQTVIQAGGLKVSLPYLPVQIPALVLGYFSSLLENTAGSDKYGAVQRYNRDLKNPSPVSWDISPGTPVPMLNLHYSL